MTRHVKNLAFIALAGLLISSLPAAPASSWDDLAALRGHRLVRVEKTSPEDLAKAGGRFLAYFTDGALLAAVSPEQGLRLTASGTPVTELDATISADDYWLIHGRGGRTADVFPFDVRVLFGQGREYLVSMSESRAMGLAEAGFELSRVTLDAKAVEPRAADRTLAGITYQDRVASLMSTVTSSDLYTLVANLSGVNSVSIGGSPYTLVSRYSLNTENITKATQYAYEYFQSLGYSPEYYNYTGAGSRNVICKKVGSTYPDQYVMICGHLDDMPSGATAPGADDNASGSAAVLLAAQLMKNATFDYSIIFALWAGEEQGLVGSGKYAQYAAGLGMQIKGVLNLDMIAWDSTGGPDIDIHSKASPAGCNALAQLLADVIATYGVSLTPSIIANGTTASDHASFWNQQYPAILAIESDADFCDYYHTVNDTLPTLNMTFFTQFVKASVGMLAHMAWIDPVELTGSALSAEGCTPANSAADPGETVTYAVTLKNKTATAFTNLTATLQATGGVTAPSGPVSYGAVAAGSSATRNFSFTVSPSVSCGGTVTMTLALQDGATNLPGVSATLVTGATQTALTENFDAVTAPTLPAGWSATVASGSATWATSSASANSAPNAAFIVDANVVTDSRLETPSIAISAGDQLTFWHKYAFEGSSWDGGVLEISIDGGAFTDILAAGGSFASGGYTATLSTGYSNPLGGRSAWCGDLAAFTQVKVNLPAAAAGKSVKFRFRLGCDSSSGDTGWYVDNLAVIRYVCCTSVPAAADPYDFNGDGYTDILWRNGTTGALGDWYVTPAGASAGPLTGTVSDGNWQVFGSGDFNSSGRADLVWRNVSTGDLAIWLMGASGYDSTVSLGSVDPGWRVLGAADLNANGNADLLWRNFNDGYLSVWLMSNTVSVLGSTFAGGISSMEWKAVGSGHFDNDGRADVLWWNATTGVLSIWFEDENGWQGDMSPGTVDTTWKITGIGDVDGNGIDDLLWRNATSGDLSVWFLNNGGTVSGTTFLGGIGDLNWKVKGVGFFNNDAYADILWRHAMSGDTVVWYLSGTGMIGDLYLGTVDPVWVTLNQGNFPGHTELP
ncbi:MAG: M20/M25/M40 family metallo-hydrolase [Acidobacteria bacterium]|nr:M20/M25/M40 family metallo-hydrolase [Acidobacteriota bacterium]